MTTSKKYMARCIELARLGAGHVSPNPMVGCVVVCNGETIGEGYHQQYGGPHAEVNAINAVKDRSLLQKSTLYVSLEPCAHHGLTPPCSDLIVRERIPRVVIGTVDPFAKVAGKGIEKLKKAGIEVEVGVLQKESRELNKRFFTYHEKKRPFIILKWAQTLDGFIDIDRNRENFGEPTWITGREALLRVHQMRAEEDAIMVGTNTAEKDNPSLTVRHCEGKNPLRVVLDRQLRLSQKLNLFDNSVKTLVFNSKKEAVEGNTRFIKIDFGNNIIPQVLKVLYDEKVLSLIVEGGRQLLESFIGQGIWDEAHVYTGNKKFEKGIAAPAIQGEKIAVEQIENDRLTIFCNNR